MMNTETVLWDDIKSIDVETSNEPVVIPHKHMSPGQMRSKDNSVHVNHACCKKLTSCYASKINSKLVYNANNAVTHKFVNGELNNKTVCIKTRGNVYNVSGNFTLTDDDMTSDLLAIYFYDGYTHRGHWYIIDMNDVRNIKMKRINDYYLCNQDALINKAFAKLDLKFK